MGKWTLCFLLLLPLTVCYDSGVTLEKTIGSEPDVTPLCTNSTLEPITLLVCKIRTERNRGEECRLFYVHGRDFEHRCDSRFTLVEKNQTIFLHLSSLTPVDSGNHTCECSFPGGTDVLHLHITVEEVNSSTAQQLLHPLIAVTIVLIITGVILALIYRRIGHSSFFTTTVRYIFDRITADAAPIRLSISRSIFPSLVNKTPEILELLHLRKDLSTHPERARHPFPVENHGLGFGGADSHPSRFTLGCKPLQYMLKVLA
ncbi:hypothetical protein L3Q82_000784 [Scortum barcoo]|uniref:Uncharacterized protein n=1 Tax=Scortum barcoo TaxID=214431 RepID=A0ACB8WD56_9TELE|nr:hypothetical protein L3Q82_000784 [Scortum barcoo]